ncbi:MAG: CCA tRNA nucleotidyltransferase [Candidatus Aenigmarchaeota archaeon]|nr:CCA tRNA nucleotidyltransferase [Candidatus Aenigmarchaeota archaeon]
MDMDSALSRVLPRIRPSEKQAKEIEAITKEVLHAAKEAAGKKGLKVLLAGSFTRNTYMLDKKEFDLFVLFPENASREALEKDGLGLGKKITDKLKGKYSIAYAEHPYVRAKINDYQVDIVPCYDVKDPAKIKSAVDRTPFHIRWLQRRMHPKLADEVRLLKQFCKALGIYGSDEKTRGFSGYLCELLIVKYGSFRNLVREASKWVPGAEIDIEAHGKRKFEGHPLIVIDPVDPNRNVAAVVEPYNFIKFAAACRKFSERPSPDFFFPRKKINLKKLENSMEKRKTKLMGITFRRPDIIDDILYPQLRKTEKRLRSILEQNEFRMLNSGCFADGKSCLILFEMEVWSLPNVRKVIGPDIFSHIHSAQFLEKYKKTGRIRIENGKYVAETGRTLTYAESKLKDSLSKSLPVLKAKGIPGYIAVSVAKGFRIIDGKEVIGKARKEEDFAAFLSEFFGKGI